MCGFPHESRCGEVHIKVCGFPHKGRCGKQHPKNDISTVFCGYKFLLFQEGLTKDLEPANIRCDELSSFFELR